MKQLLLCLLVLSMAVPAVAQTRAGVRVGVSGDPTQFVFGAHIETHPIVEHVTFRPNVLVGVGNGLTVIGVNFEFAYWVPLRRQPWSFYFGGGPALVIASSGENVRGTGRSHFGGGVNVMLGLQERRGFFTELKVGVVDSPNVVFLVGWAIR
jgi:hypothetical protein